jgi:flagellar protein FliS
MVKTKGTNWSARIVNATPAQLVLIIYELIFEAIDNATEQLASRDIAGYEKTMERARKLLMELTHDLELDGSLEYDFLSLYLFVNKLFIQSYFKKSAEPLKEAKGILNKLYDGLCEAENMLPKEQKQAIVQNAQQVYAGLTYGRGTLNESMVHDENRGFKA